MGYALARIRTCCTRLRRDAGRLVHTVGGQGCLFRLDAVQMQKPAVRRLGRWSPACKCRRALRRAPCTAGAAWVQERQQECGREQPVGPAGWLFWQRTAAHHGAGAAHSAADVVAMAAQCGSSVVWADGHLARLPLACISARCPQNTASMCFCSEAVQWRRCSGSCMGWGAGEAVSVWVLVVVRRRVRALWMLVVAPPRLPTPWSNNPWWWAGREPAWYVWSYVRYDGRCGGCFFWHMPAGVHALCTREPNSGFA